jgi:RNA polymerase sigma-B factor
MPSGAAGATGDVVPNGPPRRMLARPPQAGVKVLRTSMPRTSMPDGRRRAGGDRADEDRALFARYLDERDPIDRDVLIERFLPLARHLARRYERRGEPFDDLFQVACVGLVNAIDRFDLEREVTFSSYAVPTIVGEIKRYFRDRTWSVRVPRDLQELTLKVDRAVADLSLDLHRPPTVAEIAANIGYEEEEVLEALEASGARRATSLEAVRGTDDDSDDTLGEALGTEDQGFALAEDRATISHLTRVLTAREREVLRLRFEHDLTQAEIGEQIGVSQMQVSRIIRDALGRLRSYATADADAHTTPSSPVAVCPRAASHNAIAERRA